MTKQIKQRLLYIDLAKGITMLTILWGHVMLTGVTNTIVYAFHIPMFFFLSGIVFKPEHYPTFTSFFIQRVKTLLVPYVIFSVITWGWYLLDCLSKGISLDGSWYYLMQTFIAQGSAGYLVHNPPLWFVTCLFILEMMYYFINKLSLVINIIVSAVVSFLGWLSMQPNSIYDFKTLPWNIEVAFSAMIFYSLGNLVFKFINNQKLSDYAKNHKVILLFVTLLSFTVLCIGGNYNGHVSMAQGFLGNNGFLFYLIACVGIIFMLCLCILLESLYGAKKWSNKIIDYFAWMGKNSFYMMVLHIPVMLICVRVVSLLSGQDLTAVRYEYKYTVPAWIGMVIGCNIIIYIFTKIKKRKKP